MQSKRKGIAMTDRSRSRLLTMALTPLAAVAAWGAVRLVGIDLVLEDGKNVGPGNVLFAALVGAVGGWLVVTWLERHSRRPLTAWTFFGSTALAVSMLGPAWRADGSSAVGLMALHIVTGVVVIAGFARTLDAAGHGAVDASIAGERSGTMTP